MSRVGSARALLLVLALLPGASRATAPADRPLLLQPLRLTLGVSLPGQPRAVSSMDFDLLGGEESLKPDLALAAKVRSRRTLLTLHQATGLATLAFLGATVTVGQLSYTDRFSQGAPGTGRYQQLHEALALTSTAVFAGTGVMALLAPTPYRKAFHVDSGFFHKVAMTGVALAMVSEVVLGVATAGREGFANQAQLAQTHQVLGYASVGLMTLGAGVWVF